MPKLYVIGGPNGAGKTTIALKLLPKSLSVFEFVNADSIAAGLSPFRPESVALQSGRLMLERVQSLANAGADFAFESTLTSRTFAPFLRECHGKGYEIHLIYVWLQSADLAVSRVQSRVRAGGHSIPEATIRRRYETSRKNLVEMYLSLVQSWEVYDNSSENSQITAGSQGNTISVFDPDVWRALNDATARA